MRNHQQCVKGIHKVVLNSFPASICPCIYGANRHPWASPPSPLLPPGGPSQGQPLTVLLDLEGDSDVWGWCPEPRVVRARHRDGSGPGISWMYAGGLWGLCQGSAQSNKIRNTVFPLRQSACFFYPCYGMLIFVCLLDSIRIGELCVPNTTPHRTKLFREHHPRRRWCRRTWGGGCLHQFQKNPGRGCISSPPPPLWRRTGAAASCPSRSRTSPL